MSAANIDTLSNRGKSYDIFSMAGHKKMLFHHRRELRQKESCFQIKK